MDYRTTTKTAKRASIRFRFVKDTVVRNVTYEKGHVSEIEIISGGSVMWDYELLEALRKKESYFSYHRTSVPLENIEILGWRSYNRR